MTKIEGSRTAALLLCFFGLWSANAHAQQVALLDSGIDPDAGLNLVPGFNYFNNSSDTADVNAGEGTGHGTLAAQLVTESFSGEIVPFVVTEGSGDEEFQNQTSVARDSSLSDILGRTDVRAVGITWGTSGITGSAAPLLPELSDVGKFVAITAGDDAASQPSALATTSFNLSSVLIVGAADFDGVLLPQTNRAGTTADKYVVAIGLPDALSDQGDSGLATARITGIAGAVFLQNPEMTAAQVVEVILDSAEDLGVAGTDEEFGRGFIRNAEQVLNNVMGPVTVPTPPVEPITPANTGGGGGGGGGAGLLIGGALIGALVLLAKPKDKLEKTLVLDSYGRAFQLDLGAHVRTNDENVELDRFFSAMAQPAVSQGVRIKKWHTELMYQAVVPLASQTDRLNYSLINDQQTSDDASADVALAIASQLTPVMSLRAGYQVDAAHMFGAAARLENHPDFGASAFISGQAFSSPLSGFSPRANALGLRFAPRYKHAPKLQLGVVSVDQDKDFAQQSFSTIAQAEFEAGENASLALQLGQIEERGSLFGGAAGGLFGVREATTHALNLSAHWRLSSVLQMVANYGVGRTKVNSSANSLLSDFSSLRSDWYSVGLISNDLFRARDQLGVSLSQPLKIQSGDVNYSIPMARSATGGIAFDSERFDLSQTNATEQRMEVYYRTRLGKHLELGAFASYRKNPHHVRDLGHDTLFLTTLQYRL